MCNMRLVEHCVKLCCTPANTGTAFVYSKLETFKYHYACESDRTMHMVEMLKCGYESSGRVKDNLGSITNPNYVFCNEFYKSERICEENYATLNSRISGLLDNN